MARHACRDMILMCVCVCVCLSVCLDAACCPPHPAFIQFTTQHYILEGAREVVAAGGDSFKFNLANLDARGNSISVSRRSYVKAVMCGCCVGHVGFRAPTA